MCRGYAMKGHRLGHDADSPHKRKVAEGPLEGSYFYGGGSQLMCLKIIATSRWIQLFQEGVAL